MSMAISMFEKKSKFGDAMDEYATALDKVAAEGIDSLTVSDVSKLASVL